MIFKKSAKGNTNSTAWFREKLWMWSVRPGGKIAAIANQKARIRRISGAQ
jgi:hypothetical protein